MNYIFIKLKYFLKLIFFSKKIFLPPNKSDILIYDINSLHLIQKYFIKLQNFETAAGWAVAYHGTTYKFLGSILNEGLKNSKADHRDAGVYVTPVFETALWYADKEEKSKF